MTTPHQPWSHAYTKGLMGSTHRSCIIEVADWHEAGLSDFLFSDDNAFAVGCDRRIVACGPGLGPVR